jgi:hypothetical protein
MPERGAEAVTTQMGRLGAEDLSTTPQLIAYLPVFEIVGVDRDEIAPLLRNLILGKDRVDRTRIDAGAAVDALVRVDVIHVRRVVGMDAVDRTHLDA